jgi:hypothetical protein
MRRNRWLIAGGLLSAAAAFLHIAIIFGGPDWYRFFGAGEGMALAAERGSSAPAFYACAIAATLLAWALYAFSGAGLIRRLPLLRTALVLISAIYLVRGLILVPMLILAPGLAGGFAIWSSLVVLVYGLAYAIGTWAAWPGLAPPAGGRPRRWRNRLLVGLIVGLPLCVLAYESIAVFRARARTAEIRERVQAREAALASIPARRIWMLLAVEDPGFFHHRGIDFGTPGQGMTTLTQSLAKFLYFDRFRPGLAKLELMLVARFALDPAFAKREQLEIFINYARFGTSRAREIIGFNDAARTFYGRALERLTDREYLTLVAMLIAPGRLDPARHPEANAERTSRIEALLAGRCRPRGWRDVEYEDCASARR